MLCVRISIKARYTTLCDKFVSDLRQVSGFLRVLLFPPQNKTDRHDITAMLLKVVLNTIKQTKLLTIDRSFDKTG